MEINMTLIVQTLVFITFVLFTMKFVWPPLSRALEERQEKIADGLASAERARKELELTQHRVKTDLKQAKAEAHDIIEKANYRAAELIEQAKESARIEAQKQMKIAQEQFFQEVNNTKASLRLQLAALTIAGAEKILRREVDQQTNQVLLDQLIEEI